ncbi:mandelate racemase/muconate lactonizing enzyme family protein [Amycolatopsis carbonis]|uniref:Mandelate racemase/muconate lactonizing enzyme family protein n=1 Tax=Amycolatopsis carbonis TaxID=715471 RepID=A0A9Y2IC53_9PSEU|nr:mandelate racemase/muconate lactonizing enzyme family protein [Amycolatopsis sp. 2-15]WIX76395.1 mandelate racemase/muconate lactonizing enzyme family protein [Amycolatopsis sp. 2-15]
MTVAVKAEAFLVDLEVEQQRTDAVQAFLKQETVFVELATDDGGTALGYSYTIGTGGTAVLALLRDHLLPRLISQDARRIEAVWTDLFASTRATTVGAITSLALAAVDTALWDLKCRRAGEPLWRVAGGFASRVPLYDTEGGWLHLSTDELVAGARKSAAAGWGGVKVKVGKPTAHEDLERLGAVREAVGPRFDLMVDANQSLTAAEAIRRARAFEAVDLFWFEEPLPADDVAGHARLSTASPIPIAVGESLYSVAQFRDYLHRSAASIVQVDVARVGRDHAVAEGRAPGGGVQRAGVPALPDGAARQLDRRDSQRPLRRAHPAAARHHDGRDDDRRRARRRPGDAGPGHPVEPRRDGRAPGGLVNTRRPAAETSASASAAEVPQASAARPASAAARAEPAALAELFQVNAWVSAVPWTAFSVSTFSRTSVGGIAASVSARAAASQNALGARGSSRDAPVRKAAALGSCCRAGVRWPRSP